MANRLHVLLIAPDAPPKNTAEAIQVRRILAELDKQVTGQLIMVMPDSASGWAPRDASLELPLQHFDVQSLCLPLPRLMSRLLMSHRMAHFHVPDSVMWISWMAGHVLRTLKKKPDILYSRSSPMSAALLAARLQRRLAVPWIMHLSDPWADNPYKTYDSRDAAYEAQCFRQADRIMLTTESQAAHYRKKYPELAKKIAVSPNVMPDQEEMRQWAKPIQPQAADAPLRVVFAGSLYGERSPQPLLDALSLLAKDQLEILKKLQVDIYGNAQEQALALLQQMPQVLHYHGPVSFREAYQAQQEADIVLAIEAAAGTAGVLGKSFLPTKVIDCLALGKPMLAITPEGSETERICNEGYGWAVAPSQSQMLTARLAECVTRRTELRKTPAKAPPARYSAQTVVNDLMMEMNRLHQQAL